jgi:antitoxin YefM
MLAVNYSTLRNNLKDYCDRATDENETVIVTRKDEKNVVILSLENYNMLSKAAHNTAYLDKIERSRQDLAKGRTYTFTIDELSSMENMTAAEMQDFAQKHRG